MPAAAPTGVPPRAAATAGPRRRGRGRWVATAVAAAGAAALTASVLASNPHGVPTFDHLLAYRVVYRVETTAGGGDAVRWEALTVDRPFVAADLSYPDPPTAADAPTAGSFSTEDGLYDVDPSGMHLVGGRQPGVPAGDQDLAPQLPDLLARKLAHDTGTTLSVAGRRCHVYRFFEPPSGPVKPLAGKGDHDELCLDGDGIVLSEVWTYRGRLVYTRRAVDVVVGASGVPRPPMPSPAGVAPSGAPTVAPDPSPASFIRVPPAPPGFRPAGSFDFHLAGLGASSVVWVFVRGADVVTVEAGHEADGALPWFPSDTPTTTVALAGMGRGEAALRSDGAEIRIDAGNGRWVRVRGTETVAWLSRYAGGLEGGRV